METEKTCLNCNHGDYWRTTGVPCYPCTNFSLWQPKESLTKEYMERCLPGESSYDVVNKPKHYMLFEEQGIEVRDVLRQLTRKISFAAMEALPQNDWHMFVSDYVQMMQYLMRFMDKNGLEDLKKARFYLDKLIESY